jgi:NodT family efflux transporter outer membrane factor (OMF) lipoprotein
VSAWAAILLFVGRGAAAQQQKVPVPPQWNLAEARNASATEPVEQWWSSFGDPEFDKLVLQAAQANLDLELASARIAETRAARGIAKSGFFPSMNVTAAASRNRQHVILPSGGTARTAPVEFSNFQVGFDAAWEVDIFGGIRQGVRAATADASAAAEARNAVLVTVMGEVGRSYAELRGFQLRMNIAQRNISIQQDTLDLTKTRAAAGLATELDVARAVAQLETTKSAVPTLHSGIETAIHRLSVLVGQEPGALRAELSPGTPVPVTPPQVPVGLPSELLERRPDIRQAQKQIAAATARVKEAKAEFFPRFLLTGTAGRQASQLHDITLGFGNFFGVGPSVSLPLFTAGRIRSQVRVQDARLQQTVIAYRATVLSALEETENALVNYAQEQEQREHLQTAVESNLEAVRLSSDLYKAGLTDFLSVLDAQRELYANEDLLAQSRTAQTLDLIALYKALGGGWQSFSQP